jgi:hypothetical protein
MDIFDNSNKNTSLNNIVLICIKSVANNPKIYEGSAWDFIKFTNTFEVKIKNVLTDEIIEVSSLTLVCNFIKVKHDRSIGKPVFVDK